MTYINTYSMPHFQLTYMAKKMAERLMKEFAYTRSLNFNYRCVSCLPLNVPFGIVFELFVPWLFGGLTAFANPNKKDVRNSFLLIYWIYQ